MAETKKDSQTPVVRHEDGGSGPAPPPYDFDDSGPSASASVSASNTTAQQPVAVAEPPTYEDTSAAGPRDNLPSSDPPTLILGQYNIYSEAQPSRNLYELNLEPNSGRHGICGVEKIWYSVTASGGLRERRRHIYDLRSYGPLQHVFGHVEVVGMAGPARSYQSITITASSSSWLSCKAKEHFKAERTWGQLLKRSDDESVQVEWKDMEGKVVAIEEYSPKPKDGSAESLGRLNVQVPLEDKELDCLVSCWIARFWKSRQTENKEPLSWSKIKRRVAMSPGGGGGIYGGFS
jgi:hypothetical protein